MASRLRLTAVFTHPVQYFSPWFRHIAESCPEIELTVLYGAIPTPDQQGTGFGRAFSWDVPLTEGYRAEVCADARGKTFDSDHFFGIDVPGIEAHIAATRPNVVLVAGWHAAMQLRALRACRRLRVPVIYRGDSTLFSGPRGLVAPLWRLKTRWMLRQFDGWLAVGTFADQYLRAFGVPDPLIVQSPHCVDNQRFGRESDRLRRDGSRERDRAALGAAPSDFVVLFAGKFTARKRPLDAVRAVASLGPSAVLTMAGDGPLAAAAHAEAERLAVRVAWRGFLNQSELPAAFAAADALVVPSAWESWGLVVNEALASGLPCVVTTRVACAPDLIVSGETGYAVQPGDIDALAARLGDIRAAHRAGHDFAPACRQQAEACSFEVASNGLLTLCRRLVCRGPRTSELESPVRVVACCGGMVSVFGSERMTFELLRVIRRRGAVVHCIVNSWGSSRVVPLAMEIGATWSPGRYLIPLRRRGLTLSGVAQVLWDVAGTSAVLWRDARRLRATHVLVPDFAAVLRNLPALAALRLLGTVVVMKVGNAPDTSTFYRRMWKWGVTPAVDVMAANSHFTAAALAEVGVPSHRVRVIHNAAPSRHCGPAIPANRRRITYVGQIIPPKGPDLLLEAVAILVNQGLEVSLDLVGEMDGWEFPAWAGYHARLRARASEPDLAGRVRFLGQREDVPALLAASAVHCAPSRPEIREAFGVVVVEAKEAGVPSVVTPSGALPELVEHHRDGWVCSDASAAAIAEGLEYFLADDTRRDQAAAAARDSAGRFNHDRFAAAWLDVFGLEAVTAPSTARPVERHAH